MNLTKVLLIIQELERIGCHYTARAILEFYKNY